MSRLFIIIFINVITLQCYAQNKSIVVYSAKEDFLITKIEKYLKELKNPENNIVLFSGVTNLNQITSNIASETALREIVDFYSKQYFELNEDAIKKYDLVTNELLKNDFFLIVNTNLIFDAIEFQLYLYEVGEVDIVKDSIIQLFPTTNPLSPLKTENIILNLKDERKYIELQTAIARLFPSINIAPQAEISLVSDIQKTNGHYFISSKDTLMLYSQNSIDLDTEKENWTYHWRQIDLEGKINIDTRSIVNMEKNNSSVKVIFKSEGTYKFGLKIYDGVSFSKEDTILIKAISPPQLLLLTDRLINCGFKSLFQKKVNSVENNGIALVNGDNTWKLVIRKSTVNQKDTFELLKNFYELRKTYEREMYEHMHGKTVPHGWGTKIVYPPKPKPIPSLNQYLIEFNNFEFANSTTLIPEGIVFSFAYDDFNLRNEKLELYLEKNGVKSEPHKFKIINKPYSPFSASVEHFKSKWVIKHDALQNDSLLIRLKEFMFRLSGSILSTPNFLDFSNRKFGGSLDVGIGYTHIPKVEFLLDTVRYINSALELSATFNFSVKTINKVGTIFYMCYAIKSYSINRKYKIEPKEVSTGFGGSRIVDSEIVRNPFFQHQPRMGISLYFDDSIPIELYSFIGVNYSINKFSNGIHFLYLGNIKTEDGERGGMFFGLGLKYKFFIGA